MNTRLTAPSSGTPAGTRGTTVTGRRRAARPVAVLAALCTALVALPATAAQAEEEPSKGPGQPAEYEAASDAKAVKGAASSTDAPELPDTGYYTDTIGRGETKYYRVDLDDRSSAYLSALAHPKVGSKVGDFDKLEVQLESTASTTCSSDKASFEGGTTAYPIVAFASRRVGGDSQKCLSADQYLFKVVRDDEPTSDPGDWPLELRYSLEPGLNGSLPAPPAEGSWSTEPPAPPTGEAREVEGGAGLSTARPVSEGVWRDTVLPGETRYYRVPVDFGQQLFARAELPNAPKGDDTSGDMTFDAFALHAYTPSGAAVVSDNFERYDGGQNAVSLGLRPVEYGNRFDDKGKAVSTAGFYTLAVTMTPDLQRYFPTGVKMTLRVKLRGEAKEAPDYVDDAKAAGFAVTDQDKKAAEQGLTSADAQESDTLKLVGVIGIGAGVALVLGLGLWTLLARRRTAGATGVVSGSAAPGGPGTPGSPPIAGQSGAGPGGPAGMGPNAAPPPGSWQQ